MIKRLIYAVIISAALPLAAQPHGMATPHTPDNEVRLTFFNFVNFFNAPSVAPQQDVNAMGLEYRGAYRYSEKPIQAYLNAGLLKYGKSSLPNGYSGRLGIMEEGPVQSFNVYYDAAKNKPSADLRNVGTANANVLFGQYGWKFVPAWQIVGRATHEQLRYRFSNAGNSTFNGAEAMIRYHGFGWQFVPEAGLEEGKRNVHSSSQSYDEHAWFVGAEYIPVKQLWLSAVYRDTSRDYTSASALRNENRHVVELIGDWAATKVVHATVYYEHENVTNPVPGQGFNTQILMIGASYQF